MNFVILTITIIVIFLVLMKSRYEIYHFEKVCVNINDEKIKSNKFKIVFLSDYHNFNNNKYTKRILAEIDAQKPDIILIGGDQIVAKAGKYDLSGLNLLEKLSKKYPLVFAKGNHEARLFDNKEIYNGGYILLKTFFKENNISFLENSRVDLDNNISIYGIDIDKKYYSRKEKYYMDADYVSSKLGKCDSNRYNILLAHNPKYRKAYLNWHSDLILSGHYHGGIIGLGNGAGLFVGNPRLLEKDCKGIFKDNGCTTIISSGLGTHTIKFRLFNKPQLITVVLNGNVEK